MDTAALERWADVLVGYSLAVRPGQTVSIEGSPAAAPLLLAAHAAVLRAGGHPVIHVALPGITEQTLRLASDEQLAFFSPVQQLILEKFDARIAILADENTRSLSGADPARQARLQAARRPSFERFLQRSADGKAAWVVTLFPTNAYAQDADMSLDAFSRFVYRACRLDAPDPFAAWRDVAAEQQRMVDFLNRSDEVHVIAGQTDLRFSIKGRQVINACGRRNFPDGEVFTGPIEESVEGTIVFDVPSSYQGRSVDGARLQFSAGRVVDASARMNEAYLLKMLNVDEGARSVGEVAFGTNERIDRPTRNVLFDEKIGGTMHLALGMSYPETGGVNRSALHWDLICDLRRGGIVDVDGEPFIRAGRCLPA